MRYIVNDNDRLLHVSFGADIVCDGQSCTEYAGSVPTGYESLEAWYLAEVETVYRWKVVDGDLTLDPTAAAPAPDRTIVPIECGGTGAANAADARKKLGAATAAWELIGSWGYGGSLSADFTQFNELLFMYDAKSDNCSSGCGVTMLVPTCALNGAANMYLGAAYSTTVRFVVKLNESTASTYAAIYGGSDNSDYSIYCYGR